MSHYAQEIYFWDEMSAQPVSGGYRHASWGQGVLQNCKILHTFCSDKPRMYLADLDGKISWALIVNTENHFSWIKAELNSPNCWACRYLKLTMDVKIWLYNFL